METACPTSSEFGMERQEPLCQQPWLWSSSTERDFSGSFFPSVSLRGHRAAFGSCERDPKTLRCRGRRLGAARSAQVPFFCKKWGFFCKGVLELSSGLSLPWSCPRSSRLKREGGKGDAGGDGGAGDTHAQLLSGTQTFPPPGDR